MVDYTWVAWLEELATTIARNDEHYLVGKAKDVDWKKNKDKVRLLMYGDENIDPPGLFIPSTEHRRIAPQLVDLKPTFRPDITRSNFPYCDNLNL